MQVRGDAKVSREESVKCPKCGFTSFPGLAQCKRCGQPFSEHSDRSAAAPPVVHPSAPEATRAVETPRVAVESLPVATPRLSSVRDDPAPSFSYPDPGEVPLDLGPSAEPRLFRQAAAAEPLPSWQDELAERVAEFKQRRTGVRGESPTQTLEFDFEKDDDIAQPETRTAVQHPAISSPRARAAASAEQTADSLWSHEGVAGIDAGPGAMEAGEWTLEPQMIGPGPVQVVFDSSPAEDPLPDLPGLAVAPLGLRIAAGLADAAMLVAALVLFAAIFWKVGGTLSPTPFDAIVGLFIAGFVSFTYFALFGSTTCQTPGEAWMGLAVRNFEGQTPALGESLWRACGYLVSAAALMLGFAWILVDSESLGWHDRMSQTCLVVSDSRPASD